MNTIIDEIMNSELSNEDKTTLIKKVVYASHGINVTVAPGFYLRGERVEDEVDLSLWYRNVDEDGNLERGSTNYDAKQIVEFLIENCLTDKKTK